MTLNEYYSELMNYDWFHYYSDDFSVYKRGERNWGIICQYDGDSIEYSITDDLENNLMLFA